MKRYIPQIILAAGIVIAWGSGAAMALSDTNNVSDAERQISEYEDLGTYRNALDLYDVMIDEYPDDISWYERKANAYYQMGAFKSYVSQCESIIETFPSDVLGYQRLLEYYDETENHQGVFDVYAQVPDDLKQNEDLSRIYRDWEHYYAYSSSSFASVEPISGGYGVVSADGYFGLVDGEGSIAVECQYDAVRSVLGDRAAVCKDGEWFVIDTDGYRVEASHDNIEDMYSPSDGYILAKVGGVYGYYDEHLKNPVHFEYEDATSFCNGVAAVKQNGSWHLIDTSFNQVGGGGYEDVVRDFSNTCSRGGFVFAKLDGSYQLLSLEGSRIGTDTFDEAKVFRGSMAAVKQGDSWGFVDQSGAIVIECKFDGADSFANGIAPVQEGDFWGFVNESGEVVVDPVFNSATTVSDTGLSGVSLDERHRYIQFYKFTLEGDE